MCCKTKMRKCCSPLCQPYKHTIISNWVSKKWINIQDVKMNSMTSHITVCTGYPIPDVDNLCLLCIDFYVWDVVSIFNHLARICLSTDFAFRITDWTRCHGPHLHAILISSGVSGLATDSPCGVWGRGWTTCLLHDSPLFDSHFKMRVGMLVWSDISYIYDFLPRFTISCMKLVIFLLYNNLFIYLVLCTLIYCRRSVYSFLTDSVTALFYSLLRLISNKT